MIARALLVLALVATTLPLLAESAVAAEDPELIFPVQGPNHYSDTFDACRDGCSRRHRATDIMAAKMVPVVAAGSGVVKYVNWSSDPSDLNPDRCCTLSLDHDNGWRTVYIHLNNDTPGTDDGKGWGLLDWVVPGVRIEAGQHFGWVGDSGNAESVGSHVHFELYDPAGNRINPYPLLLESGDPIGLASGATNRRSCDFDNDGYDDLTVGAPDATVNGREGAGAVEVHYGSSAGIADPPEVWSQSTAGVPGSSEIGDGFGVATACGDIDGDGYDDLVVGVPTEDIGSRVDAGFFIALYGSSSGLTTLGIQSFSQATSGVSGASEAGDLFGSSLALGDFDDDGYDDLVIGVPGEDIGSVVAAGAFAVMYGSSGGLSTARDRTFSQNSPGIYGVSEAGDAMGSSIAVGDVNGDGWDDVIAGVPGEDIGAIADAGSVNVIFGSPWGLRKNDDRAYSQATTGIVGAAEAGDLFGFDVSSGDLNNDGYDDIIIGVPGEGVGPIGDAGAVNVIYGALVKPTTKGDQIWTQNSSGVRGVAEVGDRFGAAVLVLDVNDDGYDDIAIGVPNESIGASTQAGIVAVLYGSGSRVTAGGDEVWDIRDLGLVKASGDRFGQAMGAGDFDGDNALDLAAGFPGRDTNSGGIGLWYADAIFQAVLPGTVGQLGASMAAG